jgi:hypothetical protein
MTEITTTRCSPVQMRKNLEVVVAFKVAGIDFVALPVFSEADRQLLNGMLAARLEMMANKAEGAGA